LYYQNAYQRPRYIYTPISSDGNYSHPTTYSKPVEPEPEVMHPLDQEKTLKPNQSPSIYLL
jgi:hypothetical protein